jgi:hypothetical protein
MLQLYLLEICRSVIALLFSISLIGKVFNPRVFSRSVERFKLIPRQLVPLAALLVLSGEAATVLALALGGRLLLAGFVLALALLGVFSLALSSVLRRDIQIPCHCFGASTRPISRYDLWRNAGFVLCALGGCGLAVSAPGHVSQGVSLAAWGIIGPASAVIVAVWSQLGEIMQLVRDSRVLH